MKDLDSDLKRRKRISTNKKKVRKPAEDENIDIYETQFLGKSGTRKGQKRQRQRGAQQEEGKTTLKSFILHRNGPRNPVWIQKLKNCRDQLRDIDSSLPELGASTQFRQRKNQKYKVIDHERTLLHHQRDPSMEAFCIKGVNLPSFKTSNLSEIHPKNTEKVEKTQNDKILENEKKVLRVALLSNLTGIIHQGILQIAVASLPLSPSVLLVTLLCLEVLPIAISVVPSLTRFRFLARVDIADKTVRFLTLGGFFAVCLVISLNSESETKPVDIDLQKAGIWVLALGIFGSYFTLLAKILFKVVNLARTLKTKNQKKKVEDASAASYTRKLGEIKSFDGVVFYKKKSLFKKNSNYESVFSFEYGVEIKLEDGKVMSIE